MEDKFLGIIMKKKAISEAKFSTSSKKVGRGDANSTKGWGNNLGMQGFLGGQFKRP
jgi:hypothetical protein